MPETKEAQQNEPKSRGWKVALSHPLAMSRMVTALALATCALVLFVVHEQNRTIDMQRAVIRDLFQDSQELKTMREREARRQQQERKRQQDKQSAPTAALDGCVAHIGVCV